MKRDATIIKELGAITVPGWPVEPNYDKQGPEIRLESLFLKPLNKDAIIRISAEDPDSVLFLDYWGEFRSGGGPWVLPEIEKYNSKNGIFLEWLNAGEAEIYRG